MMRFATTPLEGVFVIEPNEIGDERGMFARLFDRDLFAREGLNTHWPQVNNSICVERATLRGLHFQRRPNGECKLLRCVAGAVWDMVVDVREGSPQFGRSFGVKLDAAHRRMIYVPEGFAHGYLALTANAEVIYAASARYNPDHESALNALDSALGLEFPIRPEILSKKDKNAPCLGQLKPW